MILPGDPPFKPSGLQMDSEERTYVASGNKLLRLTRNLIVEQTIELYIPIIDMSLSSGGDWLVVCSHVSCTVFNTTDFSNMSTTAISLDSDSLYTLYSMATFTAGSTYYLGKVVLPSEAREFGSLVLEQHHIEMKLRSCEYPLKETLFSARVIHSGFVSGNHSYLVVSDHNPPDFNGLKITRLCHVEDDCNGKKSIAILHEEVFTCGSAMLPDGRDYICGVSVVEDFADSPGTNLVVSRCRQGNSSVNLVCAIKLSDLDRIMELKSSADRKKYVCIDRSTQVKLCYVANTHRTKIIPVLLAVSQA